MHTPESIRKMYADYEDPVRDFYFDRIDEEVTAHFDSYLHRCREYCQTGSSELRFLDIGCGNGSFLARAQRQGFACEGVETCRPLAERTRMALGCPVHTTLLAECDFPPGRFDVISMYDVVEHLQDPIGDAQRVHSWLKPGGILFVLTPNDGALLRRIARFAFRSSLHSFQRPMRTLYYSHHLSYFTVDSLKSLFERTGFGVAAIETRNQEMSRLNLSARERLAVTSIFALSRSLPRSGGKLVAWARRLPDR